MTGRFSGKSAARANQRRHAECRLPAFPCTLMSNWSEERPEEGRGGYVIREESVWAVVLAG